MTDPKPEWRDEEGRTLHRETLAGDRFRLGVPRQSMGIYLTDGDARFLARYLPEALWRPTDTPCHECDHIHTKPGMCGAPALLGVCSCTATLEDLYNCKACDGTGQAPEGKPAPTDEEFDRSFGSVPEMRGFAAEAELLRSVQRLDAAIVAAAERWADARREADLELTDCSLMKAVDAKRAAISSPPAEHSARPPRP